MKLMLSTDRNNNLIHGKLSELASPVRCKKHPVFIFEIKINIVIYLKRVLRNTRIDRRDFYFWILMSMMIVEIHI